MDPDSLPTNPWNTTEPFTDYGAGNELVDKTCGQMARYFGRVVGHFTAGGHHDDCGHWHGSGLYYNWFGVSVLNEDEHELKPGGGVMYV